MIRMLFVKKNSKLCSVTKGPTSPPGRVVVCVRVGLSTVCESENVLMIYMKVSCSWDMFVWAMIGSWGSVSGGQGGPVNVRKVEVTCDPYVFVYVNV